MDHTLAVREVIALLKARKIRYKSRVTRWGNTVTIPFADQMGRWYVFDASNGIGVTSTWDDPKTFVLFKTAQEAVDFVQRGG